MKKVVVINLQKVQKACKCEVDSDLDVGKIVGFPCEKRNIDEKCMVDSIVGKAKVPKLRGNEEKDPHLEYTWSEFAIDSIKLAGQIATGGVNFKGIYGIPRGGVCLSVRLSNLLALPMVETYEGFDTTHILIVDDVVDSGNTRKEFKKYPFASLFVKPWAKMMPDYHVRKTDHFIEYPWEVWVNGRQVK